MGDNLELEVFSQLEIPAREELTPEQQRHEMEKRRLLAQRSAFTD